MKIVHISDTHDLHKHIDMPDGDVLIHSGDWFKDRGTLPGLKLFADWIQAQPHKHKIVIAGNHDFPAQDNEADTSSTFKYRDINYLKDSRLEIDGVKFWGAPWQPEYFNWAFNLPRDGWRLKKHWSMIPDDTDVLITHGPPHGILDDASPPITGWESKYPNHVGCKLLMERIQHLKLKAHCFGHIHVGVGQIEINGTIFSNASMHRGYGFYSTRNIDEPLVNKPQIIDLSQEEK
jgi:Icc-related predicted phosphoesterase